MDESKLLEIIAEYANYEVNKITRDMTFSDDLGIDSLELVDVIAAIEDAYDVEIDDEELMSGLETVGNAIDLLKEKLSE